MNHESLKNKNKKKQNKRPHLLLKTVSWSMLFYSKNKNVQNLDPSNILNESKQVNKNHFLYCTAYISEKSSKM